MTALGMTTLHLRIADFKFTHSFIICNRLSHTEVIFGIDVQKKFSLSYAWDKEKNWYIQKDGRFLTYTRNCKQKVTIGIVNSTLKIPPRHNGIITIKIKGHSITRHIAHFISDHKSTKGKDPNINIVNGIHNIEGKTSVNILVSNYRNKHVTFNKGEYVGHLEPTIENTDEERNLHPQANPDTQTTSIVTTNKIMWTSGTECFWATMPQTQTQHWGQTWSTIEGVCNSIHTRWNFHQHDTSNKNDHR